jgi:hypothetical protein
MVTAVEALGLAVTYLQEAERPHQQVAGLLDTLCIVCSSFVCLEIKEVDIMFGAHVTPHLYVDCVVLFIVVLCSSQRICVWSCREGNDRV